MSDVYKAKDHILGRIVAIKELKNEFSEDVISLSFLLDLHPVTETANEKARQNNITFVNNLFFNKKTPFVYLQLNFNTKGVEFIYKNRAFLW